MKGRERRRRWLAVLGLLIAFALVSPAGPTAAQRINFFSFFTGWPPQTYALDSTERFVEGNGRPQCSTDALVHHRGAKIRYQGSVRVHAAFVPRLERFESHVVDLATAHYGRAPRRLIHRGAFNCRAARGRRARISEHAFGNALDLQGFEFGALPRDAALPEGMPSRFRRGFRVTVLEHWGPRRARDGYHAQFLHTLADNLRRRPNIFRGIVGPPRPRHADHLHLDAAPWRYAMYGYDPVESP